MVLQRVGSTEGWFCRVVALLSLALLSGGSTGVWFCCMVALPSVLTLLRVGCNMCVGSVVC